MKLVIYLLMVLGVIVLFFLAPFISIWSLNTLFPSLAIPFNVWTYLAMIWVHSGAMGITYKSSK
jgi:hypothetical protein